MMVAFQTSMIINQSTEWKPRTYYILENIQSGKKYIGQTVQDINHYLGSGAYWIPHCKKHGGYNRDNISIVHSKLYESKEAAQQYLDEFKKTNVDYWQTSNKEWANLCEENTEDSPLTGGEISRRVNAKRVADGTHNLLGPENNNKRVADGIHPFVGGENARKRVADGTHHLLGGEIARKSARKRVADGTHNFLGGENVRQQVADGTHHFLGGALNRKRVADGTHNLLGGENVRKQVADGTHHWLGPENNNKRVADGTHPFLGGEISRRRMEDGTHNCLETHICPHCNKEGKGPVMRRFHFDKCKLRNWSNIFDE